jgi:hypothetical protein
VSGVCEIAQEIQRIRHKSQNLEFAEQLNTSICWEIRCACPGEFARILGDEGEKAASKLRPSTRRSGMILKRQSDNYAEKCVFEQRGASGAGRHDNCAIVTNGNPSVMRGDTRANALFSIRRC